LSCGSGSTFGGGHKDDSQLRSHLPAQRQPVSKFMSIPEPTESYGVEALDASPRTVAPVGSLLVAPCASSLSGSLSAPVSAAPRPQQVRSPQSQRGGESWLSPMADNFRPVTSSGMLQTPSRTPEGRSCVDVQLPRRETLLPLPPLPADNGVAEVAQAGSANRNSVTDHLFDSVDRDHNGVISRDEFRTALSSGVIRKNSIAPTSADAVSPLVPTGFQRNLHEFPTRMAATSSGVGNPGGGLGRPASLSALAMDFSKRRASC